MTQGRFIAGSRDFEPLRDYISLFYAERPITIVGQRIFIQARWGTFASETTRVRRIKNRWHFEEHKPEDAL